MSTVSSKGWTSLPSASSVSTRNRCAIAKPFLDRRGVGHGRALVGHPAAGVDTGRRQPGRPVLSPRDRVQQHLATQVGRLAHLLGDGRRAARDQHVRHQPERSGVRPVAVAEPDGTVDVVLAEVDRVEGDTRTSRRVRFVCPDTRAVASVSISIALVTTQW